MNTPDFFDGESEDDPDENPLVTSEMLHEASEKAEELGRKAQKFGLYQNHFDLAISADPETGDPIIVIMTNFFPGDVAWSDRVQNPETNDVNKEFRAIQSELEQDDFEAYRARLEQRLQGGEEG